MFIHRFIALALTFVFFTHGAYAGRRRAVMHPRPVPVHFYEQGGYAGRPSVAQGETIAFHIASGTSPFNLEIVNLARPETVLLTIPNLTSVERDCTGLYETGCQWPVTTTLTVPRSWPSGYYAARFPRSSSGYRYIFFIVRTAVPATESPIVVAVSTHTWQAYNSFGNRNLYPSNSPERARRVHYHRPYHDDSGLGRYARWDQPFVEWMTRQNIPFEVVSDLDLEDPTLLGRYNLVVLVGHSEYWTAAARANVEAFSANGGHIAIFGGNSMWWQIRLEDDGNRIVGYKSAALDPETGRNNAVVTVNWFDEPVLRPENLIFGSSFRYGGYTNRDDSLPVEQRLGYTITDPSSWVFSGLPVARGQQFGRIAAGLETDGVLMNCGADALALAPDGSDGTPLNFHILATTPAEAGYGAIGIYTNAMGGAVFNAGTQNWAHGLATDAVVETVTKNVLQRLATGAPLPYDPVVSSVRLRDTFNCPMPRENVIPGYRARRESTISSRCAYEGPSGLELRDEALPRNFAPTPESAVDRLETRFYVNADAVAAGAPFAMLSFIHRVAGRNTRHAKLELDPAAKAVRLVLYRPDGVVAGATEFVPLGSGWHSVQAGWRSPGSVTLQIDERPAATLENTFSGQLLNELHLGMPLENGHLCVDALAAGLEKLPRVPELR